MGREGTGTYISSDKMNFILPTPMLVDVLVRLDSKSVLVRDEDDGPPLFVPQTEPSARPPSPPHYPALPKSDFRSTHPSS